MLTCGIGTGYHALGRARLRLGDTVVITAASGGVGIHAVKLARLMGMHVVAISGSPAKTDRLRAAGADEVVIQDSAGVHEQVRALSMAA